MLWEDYTGQGVRVGVIDSGIHAGHPHVGEVAGGVTILDDGETTTETSDRVGHGTAVAAAIREKAPDASLYAVRVFDRSLSTTVQRIVHAVHWAADAGLDIINLSLGTSRQEHRGALLDSVRYAAARGSVVVAAAGSDGTVWLPGSLEGVIGVGLDWACPRDGYTVAPDGASLAASGYPRPIPGVPVEANLKGISFAVANMTGLVARACEAHAGVSAEELADLLRTRQLPDVSVAGRSSLQTSR
jgi:subtilisin family serine protease